LLQTFARKKSLFAPRAAVVNVVLKSGANGHHGSAYEFNRNSYFNTRNPPGPNADRSTDLVHQFGYQFGKITNVQTDPRAMQFGLRFIFRA
jgi:hypothetical protein